MKPLVACLCLSAVVYPASAESLLAVVLKGEGVLNLYRPNNVGLRLLKAIPVGKNPSELCADPEGKRIFVGQVDEKSIAVVDVASQTVTSTFSDPGLKTPDGCIVSPDGATLYEIDQAANAVFVFDSASGKLKVQIPVGEEPRRALFMRDGKQLLISNAHSDTISVIDLASNKVVRTIKTGHEPREMLWTPDGKYLVVSLVVDDSIAYFKAESLEFEQQTGTERSPQRIAITPDGLTLLSLSRWRNALTIIDLTGGEARRVVNSLPVGRNAFGMVMSSDGKYVYTAHSSLENTLSVIELRTMRIAATYPTGKNPLAMLYLK